MQKISFVIPCYRSEHTLAAVHEELTATMQTLPQYDYEVVLINDCSPDGHHRHHPQAGGGRRPCARRGSGEKLWPARRADGWFPPVYR